MRELIIGAEKTSGAIRRPPRLWAELNYKLRLIVGCRRFRLSHHLDGLAGPARTATTSRCPTPRWSLVVRHGRRLIRDDSRSRASAALLHGVNRSRIAARQDDPEFNPAV